MKLVIIVCSLVLLILLFARKPLTKVFEGLSFFMFRVGFSFFLLFGVHLLLGLFGFFVPINLFTGTVVAALGVPGVASVLVISILI